MTYDSTSAAHWNIQKHESSATFCIFHQPDCCREEEELTGRKNADRPKVSHADGREG